MWSLSNIPLNISINKKYAIFATFALRVNSPIFIKHLFQHPAPELNSVSLRSDRTCIWGRGKRINLLYSFSNFCSLSCSKAAALFVSLDALDLLLVGSTVAPTSFFVEEQGGAALESSLHIDGAGVCNRSCFSVFDIALILLYCLSMLLPMLSSSSLQ